MCCVAVRSNGGGGWSDASFGDGWTSPTMQPSVAVGKGVSGRSTLRAVYISLASDSFTDQFCYYWLLLTTGARFAAL